MSDRLDVSLYGYPVATLSRIAADDYVLDYEANWLADARCGRRPRRTIVVEERKNPARLRAGGAELGPSGERLNSGCRRSYSLPCDRVRVISAALTD